MREILLHSFITFWMLWCVLDLIFLLPKKVNVFLSYNFIVKVLWRRHTPEILTHLLNSLSPFLLWRVLLAKKSRRAVALQTWMCFLLFITICADISSLKTSPVNMEWFLFTTAKTLLYVAHYPISVPKPKVKAGTHEWMVRLRQKEETDNKLSSLLV